MSKINIFIFIVIAVALIWGGVWYNGKLDRKAQNEVAAEQERIAIERAKIMEKLVIKDIVVGTGAEATSGKTVSVHYVGTLEDGTKFDSSHDRGQPFGFTVGAGEVIQGWDLGVVGMKVGGKRNLTIPPELGYGENGIGPIPGNATLKFIVELLAVSPAGSSPGR